jgi:DnaJ-class molecular chaperone
MGITLEESLFGFTRNFEHLDGTTVTVNREGKTTIKDTKHLVRERGLVNNQGITGNLVVKFKVTIPEFTD